MSLTVYLSRKKWISYDDGITHTEEDEELFSKNITHNLNIMAGEAGIYTHLWRPDELGIENAYALIEPLKQSLKILKANPERFKKFNPYYGWGDYEGLVEFMEDYYNACVKFPNAKIEVSR